MTKEEEVALRLFETRIRQLILKYKELEQENLELYSMVDEKEQALKKAEEEIEHLKSQYSHLKSAKIIEVSGNDVQETKTRIAKMVKEIDKCIALLNV